MRCVRPAARNCSVSASGTPRVSPSEEPGEERAVDGREVLGAGEHQPARLVGDAVQRRRAGPATERDRSRGTCRPRASSATASSNPSSGANQPRSVTRVSRRRGRADGRRHRPTRTTSTRRPPPSCQRVARRELASTRTSTLAFQRPPSGRRRASPRTSPSARCVDRRGERRVGEPVERALHHRGAEQRERERPRARPRDARRRHERRGQRARRTDDEQRRLRRPARRLAPSTMPADHRHEHRERRRTEPRVVTR